MGAKSGRRRVRERPARANKLEGKGRELLLLSGAGMTTINDAASGVSERRARSRPERARRQIYYDTGGVTFCLNNEYVASEERLLRISRRAPQPRSISIDH